MQTSIKVYCRFRPSRHELSALNAPPSMLNAEDIPLVEFFNSEGEVDPLQQTDINKLPHTIIVKNSVKTLHQSSFDCVFLPYSTQSQVYQPVRSLVDGLFNGNNATIFSYGLTGSGKTFSLFGPSLESLYDPTLQGIFPRAVNQIFDNISSDTSSSSYSVSISLLEIYKESLSDMLSSHNLPLAIREDVSRGIFVQNLSCHIVSSSEELMSMVTRGLNKRITASTRMNATSSRSHVLAIISLVKTVSDENGKYVITSRFNVSDLAGSERVSRTEVEGVRLEEAKKINQSLSTLGNVIRAIVDESPHVPYRDSKLTLALRDSLGGNSHSLVLANCSMDGDDLMETVSTLQFAARVARVKNFVKQNKVESVESLTYQLKNVKGELSERTLEVSLLKEFLTAKLGADWDSQFDLFLANADLSSSQAIRPSLSSTCRCSATIERLLLERSQSEEIKTALVKTLKNKSQRIVELEREIQNPSRMESDDVDPRPRAQSIIDSHVFLSDPIPSEHFSVRKRRSSPFINWLIPKAKRPSRDTNHYYLTGFLYKKTTKNKWKERWFALDAARKTLSYYYTEKDLDPVKTFNLTLGVRVIGFMDGERSNCFEVYVPSESDNEGLKLSSASQSNMSDWMRAINYVINQTSKEPEAQSPSSSTRQVSSFDFCDKSGWVYILADNGSWVRRFITLAASSVIVASQTSSALSPDSHTFKIAQCTAKNEGTSGGFFSWSVSGDDVRLIFGVESECTRDDWLMAFMNVCR
ncbi:hypothetical protein GEMRC1_008627 [Eukaryota sp. GEM-RC1]